jgi:hypothetical protein
MSSILFSSCMHSNMQGLQLYNNWITSLFLHHTDDLTIDSGAYVTILKVHHINDDLTTVFKNSPTARTALN